MTNILARRLGSGVAIDDILWLSRDDTGYAIRIERRPEPCQMARNVTNAMAEFLTNFTLGHSMCRCSRLEPQFHCE
jgi:hypothetical protein